MFVYLCVRKKERERVCVCACKRGREIGGERVLPQKVGYERGINYLDKAETRNEDEIERKGEETRGAIQKDSK